MFGTPFELLGSVHLITIVAIIAVTVLLPKFYKNKSEDQKSVMSKIIATVIALHVIISPYKDLYILANPYDWRETIPLHMCDLSEIFLIWFLLGGPRILYLCAFFWGLAGASMAILTPDISHHDLDYIFFMVGHGMILVGIMYATVSLGNRPYAKDILKVSAITALILLPKDTKLNIFKEIIGKTHGIKLSIKPPMNANNRACKKVKDESLDELRSMLDWIK